MTLNITIPNPTTSDIAKARELVEQHLADTKRVADSIRARHARAVLQDEFPEHTLAVFARTWETDEYYLARLTSTDPTVADINIEEDGASGLPFTQRHAIETAELALVAIDSDDDIWEHLDMPDEDHEGWYEFHLTLNDAADLTGAPGSAAETLNMKETQ